MFEVTASKIAAFIPIDRRLALARQTALPTHTEGSALFADISGFVPLTAVLTQTLGAQRGAEELTHCLNQLYDALIHQVHQYLGCVISFSGDAITCWFDEDDGRAAVTCALAMQAIVKTIRFEAMRLLDNEVTMAIKTAVVTGKMRRFVVGDPDIQLLDILAGQTFSRLRSAEQLASANELIISEAISQVCPVTITDKRVDAYTGNAYVVISDIYQPAPPIPWATDAPLDDETAKPWLLRPVFRYLQDGQEQFMSQLRSSMALFLSFHGIDYDNDPEAGEKLNLFICWVQQILTRYGGHLLQVTMGDKGSYLYASFGALATHPDDAERAVAAALTLNKLPEQLSFVQIIKMGLGYGKMHAGAYGGDSRQTYGILGDAVNVAARLMEAAPDWTIWCDFETYKRANKKWGFEALTPIAIKGKAGLVRVYTPTGQPPAKQASALPKSPMVGREAERYELSEALTAVSNYNNRIILLEGEAGLGKSRLVQEFIRMVRAEGFSGLMGTGQSIEQNTPYRVWREIIGSYFDIDDIHDPQEQEAQVWQRTKGIAPHQLHRLPLLNDILDIQLPANEFLDPLDPAARQRNLTALIVELFRVWAEDKPFIVIVEDAHWLDTRSWRLLLDVAQGLQMADMPFVLLVTTRPLPAESVGNRSLQQLKTFYNSQTLSLTPLSQPSIQNYIRQRLHLTPQHMPTALVDFVWQRSQGNPFFVEELLMTLQQEKVLTLHKKDGGYYGCKIQADLQTLPLPNTVQDLILGRIDKLSPAQQLVLQVASVIGKMIYERPLYLCLQQVTEWTEPFIQAQLQALVQQGFLEVRTAVYTFRHAMTQDIIYNTLLFAHRRQFHNCVVDWLETQLASRTQFHLPLASILQLLVHHCQHSENTPKECQYAMQAGELSAKNYAHEDALLYFNRVFKLTSPDEATLRFAILLAKEEAFHALGRREAQQEIFDQLDAMIVQEEASSLTDHIIVAIRRTRYANVTADYDFMIVMAKQVIELAQIINAPDLIQQGYFDWGVALSRRGKFNEAEEKYRLALEQENEQTKTELLADIYNGLGNLYNEKGQEQVSLTHYHKALEVAQERNALPQWAAALGNLGNVYADIGYIAKAKTFYQQALVRYRQLGAWRIEGMIHNNMGAIAFYVGDYTSAKTDYEKSFRIKKEVGDVRGQSVALNNLGELYNATNQPNQGLAYAKQGYDLAKSIGAQFWTAYNQHSMGESLVLLEDWEKAVETFAEAVTLRRELLHEGFLMESLAGWLWARWKLGDNAINLADTLDELEAYLKQQTPTGTASPFRIYWRVYRVMEAIEHYGATNMLTIATKELQERADKIDHPLMRESFLQIKCHRAILQASQVLV